MDRTQTVGVPVSDHPGGQIVIRDPDHSNQTVTVFNRVIGS